MRSGSSRVFSSAWVSHTANTRCIADTEDGLDTPFVATAPWGYFRLRDVDYADGELEAWIARAREPEWSEAFVFFKHEDEARGPEFARRFSELA